MRRCRLCNERSVVNFFNIPLCEKHFIEFYEKKVEDTIEKYKLFSKSDNILVAISGGKDSCALSLCLHRLGYEFEGLFINLRINSFSKCAYETSKNLFEKIGRKLNVIDIKDYGIDLKNIKSRPPCSACGIVKRYLMNKYAYENEFDVLVTAHTLDDIVSLIFLNLNSGNLDLINKLKPKIPSGEKLVKKAKPLFFMYEKYNKLYLKFLKINYCEKVCPLSKNNKQNFIKEKLSEIEKEIKFFSYNFVKNFLKITKEININKHLLKNFSFCIYCGYPTQSSDKICSFCRLIKNG